MGAQSRTQAREGQTNEQSAKLATQGYSAAIRPKKPQEALLLQWGDAMKVLLVREPYATLIAMGKKIIETRRYAVPKTINTSRRIGIVGCNGSQSFLLATCCIAGSFKYASREQWKKDINVHKVKPNTEFDWDDKTPRYGWLLTGIFELDVPQRFYPRGPSPFQEADYPHEITKKICA